MKIVHPFIIFTFSILFLNCSNDENTSFQETSENSCGLNKISCAVPFPDESNYPIFSKSEVITVGGTIIDSVQSALNKINETRRSLFFPSGIYRFPVLRNRQGNITNQTILSFANTNNLEIYGESGTIFQLDFDQETPTDLEIIRSKQVSLITLFFSKNIYIHDLKLKGNFDFTGTVSDTISFHTEHRNLLIANSKSVYIYDLASTNAEGDAITISATSDSNNIPNNTSNIFVTNVTVDNLNRNGISLAGAGLIDNVFISKSSFGGNIRTQQIDFEPTENASKNLNITNVDIWDNRFSALALSSNRSRQGAISILTVEGIGIGCVYIRNNDIKNDIQILRGATNIILDNNTNIPSLVITNNANTINVIDNVFNLSTTPERAYEREGAGVLLVNRNDAEPSKITFLNNVFKREISTAGNNITKAFIIKNANLVLADSNLIDFTNTNQNSTSAIGFSLNFEFNNGNDSMSFTNHQNEFINITDGNELELTGLIENILVFESCQ